MAICFFVKKYPAWKICRYYFVTSTYRNILGYSCQRSAFFVTIAVKWSKRFVNVRIHCIVSNLKIISKISTLLPMEKFLRTPRVLGHSNQSLPITTVYNTAERSFSKFRLIKTFHRSTMTDERLTNLARTSIESETAKTLDMTELTETFTFLKTWRVIFSVWNIANAYVCLLYMLWWCCIKCFHKHLLKTSIFCFHKYSVLNAMYCILGAGGPNVQVRGDPQQPSAGPGW